MYLCSVGLICLWYWDFGLGMSGLTSFDLAASSSYVIMPDQSLSRGQAETGSTEQALPDLSDSAKDGNKMVSGIGSEYEPNEPGQAETTENSNVIGP